MSAAPEWAGLPRVVVTHWVFLAGCPGLRVISATMKRCSGPGKRADRNVTGTAWVLAGLVLLLAAALIPLSLAARQNPLAFGGPQSAELTRSVIRAAT